MTYSLVVMAAGIGSRYGSFKQIDGIGPNNEFLLEYSIYDAIKAGFNDIVLIVNKNIKDHLSKLQSKKTFSHVNFRCIEQGPLNTTNFGIKPFDREKPWGTGHIITLLDGIVNNPFCIINADDFYGLDSYKIIYNNIINSDNSTSKYFMIGYNIENTLSDNGSVSRGLCQVDEDNNLIKIEEKLDIKRINNTITSKDLRNNTEETIDNNAIVSMNLWGFNPTIFPLFENSLKQFLDNKNTDLQKDEFYIPQTINELLQNKLINVQVNCTPDQWYGVTYKEDKALLKKQIMSLITKGNYPGHIH